MSGLIDALGIGSNLTLVIHDWGSGRDFRWAYDHENSVKAIAFMEGMTRPLTLDDMSGSLRTAMRMMRSPGVGWLMISVGNIFVRKVLPDLTYAKLSPEALAYYASAFPTIASRKAIRQWPREVPFGGRPADNTAVVEAYREWLTRTDLPKLLFYGNGCLVSREPLESRRRPPG